LTERENHLDIEQIEWFLEAPGGNQKDFARSERFERASHHLATCENCQRLVSMHKNWDRFFLSVTREPAAEATVDCPPESVLIELAAGMVPKSEAEKLLTHITDCSHCGPLLRQATAVLSDELSADDTLQLQGLQSGKPDWQVKLARQMTAASREKISALPMSGPRISRPVFGVPWWKMLFEWPRIVWVGALASLLMVAGWLALSMMRPAAEQLLAQAYSDRRTLELRIAGAKYAPIRAQRGTDNSNLDKSPYLLRAEAIIGERLIKNPSDPRWLQAKGRADLLDGNYESATKSFKRALEAQPDSSPLWTDLASAYFERAEADGGPMDYASAIEYLGKVLAKSPDDRVALFNRAIVCERMLLYTQAKADWEHYLQIDPRGEWADDARKHLAAIQEKLNKREMDKAEPLLSPAEIAQGDINNPVFLDKVNDSLEDYLRLAITEWLPNAYVQRRETTNAKSNFRAALKILAEVAKEKHDDPWFADLLSGATSPGFDSAVERLSKAVLANDKADTDSAHKYASEAVQLFESGTPNEAGILGARIEDLFSANLAQDGNRCRGAAEAAEETTKKDSYHWLQIQFHLEKGSCSWLLEDLGSARQQYLQAGEEARLKNYKTIYLRTQDHVAGVDCAIGDLHSAWQIAEQALAKFWAGRYPDVRGYNLYYNFLDLAQVSGLPHLQVVIWRDGLKLGESSPDIAQRAIAHSQMASAAWAIHDSQFAELEFDRASQLFALSPQIDSTRIAQVEAETRRAQVEIALGEIERASSRLSPLQPEIQRLSDRYLAILFFNALGNSQLRLGNLEEAEISLRHAVIIAEFQLNSLNNEEARLEWRRQSSDAYRNFTQLLLRRGDPEGALEFWEWYRGATLRAGIDERSQNQNSSIPQHLPRVAKAAMLMPDLTGETIISYALLPQGLQTWVYDSRGVFSHWAGVAPDEVKAKIAQFRSLCADPGSDRALLRQKSRGLYNLFVEPIEQHLSKERTLSVELDDALTGLPFDALLDSENRYLGERGPIASLLGIYYRRNSNDSLTVTKDSAVLIAAVPTPSRPLDPPVVPLADAVDEGAEVASLFRSATLIKGRDATVNRIRVMLPDATIFHFAGHAINSSGHAGLMLSDALLSVSSLNQARFPKLQLAVFSACDTQDGSMGGVNDPDSLVRAFLSAGIPRVIASRWNVDSVSTRHFMSLFYQDLLQGRSVTQALFRAQTALRNHPETSHPFYWSAFTAIAQS
jgi:CHAT domain-containing protein/cytochrome c-type biogenesis protein CcmH/NrfG